MADVYWLEQTEADVPAEDGWLTSSELLRQQTMRIAKRRADWRLGRWTAKRAVAYYLKLPGEPQALATIEIRPASCGAPEVFLTQSRAAVMISLSHRAGAALCAVTNGGTALGCDLEVIEPHSNAFITDYFTSEEQTLVAKARASDRPLLLTLLWSGKESALKALRAGLRLDTRSVRISLDDMSECEKGTECLEDATLEAQQNDPGWHPLQANYDGRLFHGWWQHTGSILKSLVAVPPPAPPILLRISN